MAFSIDAADKELYEKLRVNGKFEKTLKNVEGAWVKDQSVILDKGKIKEYRVVMKVTFVLSD